MSLRLHRASRTLRAATHGRGMWDLAVPIGALNPVPAATSISPANVAAGGAAFTLTVNGSNFLSSSVVLWNGQSRPTTFVSSGTLTAAITAADIAAGGSAQVNVTNPAPGGGASNLLTVTIALQAPSFPANGIVNGASFTPGQAAAGGMIGSLFGTNLSGSTAAAQALPLTAILGGTSVMVNGIAAPLLSVSPGQINFLFPWETLAFNASQRRGE